MAKLLISAFLIAIAAFAQAPARVVGAVSAVDAAARTLTIRADDGTEHKVKVADGAKVSQLAPGETSLQNAREAEFKAVTAGDRVLARGPVAGGVLEANLLVLMSKSDIAKRQQQEQMAWATKGISGIVTAVDKAANTVTLNVRGAEGVKAVVVAVAPNANIKRYAEGSVKYSEAKVSSLGEIEVSDQVRALGERSADGASYTAAQLVSGAFRNIAVTVASVDAATGMVEVVDLDTKKKLKVAIPATASLRRMPEMAARMIAMAMNGGGMPGMAGGMPGGGMPGGPGGMPGGMGMRPSGGPSSAGAPGAGAPSAGAPGAGGLPNAGAPPAGAPGGPGMRPGGMGGGMGPGGMGPGGMGPGGGMGGPGGMRRPSGDIGQFLERFPAFQVAELKKDEPLILSVSKTSDPAKAIAITVLAGVEPILATPSNQSRAMMLGTWNLDGGGGMMGGGMGNP